MARKLSKHDVSVTLAVAGTDGDDILIGSNDDTTGADTLNSGAGNDYLDGLQGADILTGGSGADTFKIHSWASSNLSTGVDTITDFEAVDKIDLSNISVYSGADHMDVQAVDFSDITFEAITGGNILRVAVWEGDATWDVELVVLGETPDVSSFIL